MAYVNTNEKGAVMQITDVVGRVISQTILQGQSGSVKIDMRSLQSGIYRYRILENGISKKQGRRLKK